MFALLISMICSVYINENLTIYPIIPPDAGQGWKLELFELAEPVLTHYHKIQRQFIVVAEGELTAFYGGAPIILRRGDIARVDPGIPHSLVPKGKARFFTIDLPGFNYPEDVCFDPPLEAPAAWAPIDLESVPFLDAKYYESRIERGSYAVYELIPHVTLLEIHDSPISVNEGGIFIVMNGTLNLEMDGLHQIFKAGESVQIAPQNLLKSAHHYPVRILYFCFF
jgi:quercetin dioxygenase-like cupin family protein